jgi:N-terminal acetyltransferase B complex non-catalytic subunit
MEHGQGGSLARDWYRMKGIEELAKREQGESGWLCEKELGEFLEKWTGDDLAYVHSFGRGMGLMNRYRNYAYYQHSITASRALLSTRQDLVKVYITKLDDLHVKHVSKERAPLLAKLELDLILVERSSDLALAEEEWKTLVTEYWTRWGSKGSIVPELEAIAGDRREWVKDLLERRIAEGQVCLT